MKALAAFATGARGTGKTAWCKQWIKASGSKRVMVWDYKHDDGLSDVGKAYADWAAFVAACTRPQFTARYLVSPDHDPHEQFEAFCRLAWREGNLLMFVDELAEVTKANKAPPAWRKCVNVGRSYDNGTKSLSILAASQRPPEVDKSFLGNCDVIHAGRLGYASDARQLAAMWGIQPKELATLPDLHWIEKRADAPEVARGVLSFSRKKPAVKPAKTRP
ncbi:hypothetical protein ACS5PN_03860 [Roseateles sp. NT4]|uniref:hypothetical protein n=1 Tax=Roseateles sp. NT4 TaxID=3453715 RepID=UPI003EEE132A